MYRWYVCYTCIYVYISIALIAIPPTFESESCCAFSFKAASFSFRGCNLCLSSAVYCVRWACWFVYFFLFCLSLSTDTITTTNTYVYMYDMLCCSLLFKWCTFVFRAYLCLWHAYVCMCVCVCVRVRLIQGLHFKPARPPDFDPAESNHLCSLRRRWDSLVFLLQLL